MQTDLLELPAINYLEDPALLQTPSLFVSIHSTSQRQKLIDSPPVGDQHLFALASVSAAATKQPPLLWALFFSASYAYQSVLLLSDCLITLLS